LAANFALKSLYWRDAPDDRGSRGGAFHEARLQAIRGRGFFGARVKRGLRLRRPRRSAKLIQGRFWRLPIFRFPPRLAAKAKKRLKGPE
jgi:hypothetical protein